MAALFVGRCAAAESLTGLSFPGEGYGSKSPLEAHKVGKVRPVTQDMEPKERVGRQEESP